MCCAPSYNCKIRRIRYLTSLTNLPLKAQAVFYPQRNCAIAVKQFLHCPAHPPLLAKYARYQSHLCQAKSHQIAVAMSLCLKEFISQKKSLDSSHVHSLHLSPHSGILPPQVTKQLHKNAQLNLQYFFFNQPLLNLCTSLPHCLNIYKLFRKWQSYPNL